MFDTPKDKTVTIKKTDITGDEEIGGATLELTPKTEQTEDIFKDVTFSSNFTSNSTTELSEGEYKKEANKITWVSLSAFSDNNALTITDIKAGTYILKETIAPDGYTIATEIEFTVNSDGTVTRSEGNELVPVTDRIITVQDDISRIEISKKEINGTSELPGAILTLTKTGNFTTEQISKVEEATDNRSIIFEADGITWTSGERPITLNQLPDGDYTLTETTAPEGYTIAESINFTIENGKIIPKGTDI